MKVNIVCMKWGQRYGTHYVNLLYRGILRHLSLPFNFICFTDNGQEMDAGIQVRDIRELVVHESMRNTVYTKYTIMHSMIGLKGPTLFLDIDLMVTNSMDDLFSWKKGRFCIIRNWIAWRKTLFQKRPLIGNSSVFRFDAGTGAYDHVLDSYLKDPKYVYESFDTEQAYMSHCVASEIEFWPSEWVQSFKANCSWTFPLNFVFKPRVRPDTKVLVFHGRPDPHEAIHGFKSSVRKSSLPLPELAKHWDIDADQRPAKVA